MAVPEERRRTTTRLVVLQVGAVVVFAALAICFWVLQVVQHKEYLQLAENNHQRTLVLRAPRGVLFDRNGKVLVENRHSYTISIDRELTTDLEQTVTRLTEVAGLDLEEVQHAVERQRSMPRYRPILIVEDASLQQVAAVRARRLELPDVRVEQVPVRQ